ncbi:DUF6415 family natural product biosynthesis protein [Streptomyces caeni]|uniref:DUF6415 family natural product biosynthesis protein n=1 Tax=Streptomyces caeni TaxID=2307231 RepID=A0ABW4IR01_9ACTN
MTGTAKTESGTRVPDIAAMRETANRLLDPDATPEALPPAADELERLTGLLREHLGLLMPQIEQLTERLPKDSIPRYCALACTGEARRKLAAAPSPAPGGAVAHARRLARSLTALVDHYETLAGPR